jgi:hypothetical protein
MHASLCYKVYKALLDLVKYVSMSMSVGMYWSVWLLWSSWYVLLCLSACNSGALYR